MYVLKFDYPKGFEREGMFGVGYWGDQVYETLAVGRTPTFLERENRNEQRLGEVAETESGQK
jgi:hypothetical protein